MSGRENYMAARIDRNAENMARRALRPARSMFLRMKARLDVRNATADIEDPMELAEYLENVADIVGERLHPITGRVSAMTKFAAVARDIGSALKLSRAVARAQADQAFSELTDAANDRGDH